MDEFDFSRLNDPAPDELRPSGPGPGLLQMGVARHKSGDLRAAAAVYEEVLKHEPDNAEALHLLGLVAYQAGQPEPAIDFMTRALALRSDDAAVYNNRGLARAAAHQFEAALEDYDQAIAMKPTLVDPHQHRAAALRAVGRFEEAVASLDRALELRPDSADVLSDRGAALKDLGRREEALASYDAAIRINPRNIPAWYNRGGALRDLGQVGEAIESYSRVLELNPDLAIAHHNRALCRLQFGDYAGGFEEYEWRKRCPTFDDPRYGLDRTWRGEPLTGKSLYVFPELYQGDVIQFSRFALAADQAGARVSLAAPRAMHALLRTLSPTIELVDEDQVAEGYDYQSPLMSLPHGLRTTLQTLPSQPYLRAEPARIAHWRDVIGPENLKIGVVWQGSTAPYALPLQRSFPLAALEGLAALPHVRLISLQKVNGLDQLAGLPPGMTVQDLGEGFDPGPEAFVDTAAAMSCCDLVITPDTSVAHLAGALGVNTWLALPAIADWRWMSERSDSPWYPTLRIFRQSVPSDWTQVFADMAQALEGMR